MFYSIPITIAECYDMPSFDATHSETVRKVLMDSRYVLGSDM